MEIATETMVFLGAGVILMGLVIGFMHEWTWDRPVNDLKVMYSDGGSAENEVKVSMIDFFSVAREFWEDCNHTYINDTRTYVVYNTSRDLTGELKKGYMFDHYKALGWCKGIQSKAKDCGQREDVNFTVTLEMPCVVTLWCENDSLYIEGG